MRAKTFAEHRIRARAAVQYPGWRVDFVGPATAVIWLLGMWMVSIVVMAAAMGVRL